MIIQTSAGAILTDPWLTGKAFNESWTLHPEPQLDTRLYSSINYLWISHEHPDHFSVATLKALPEDFKQRVTVLFQQRNSTKLFDTMREWGFRNFVALPDRTEIQLSPHTRLTCYQVGLIDSVLIVCDRDSLIVNLNDGDLPRGDLRSIRRRFGTADLVLNQFSIAGMDGYFDPAVALPRAARAKLDYMTLAHRLLGAKFTVPFASFAYFSTVDNHHINQYANSIQDTQRHFDAHRQGTVILAPGDEYTVGEPWDNAPGLAELQRAHDTLASAPLDSPPRISVEELAEAFRHSHAQLSVHYPQLLLWAIGPLRWRLLDTVEIVETDYRRGTFSVRSGKEDAPVDIELYSQPLHYALMTPFGFEALGTSGRYRLLRSRRRWRLLKVISMLLNQEVYLRPGQMDARTRAWLWERLRANAVGQAWYKRRQRTAMGHVVVR